MSFHVGKNTLASFSLNLYSIKASRNHGHGGRHALSHGNPVACGGRFLYQEAHSFRLSATPPSRHQLSIGGRRGPMY